jgi:uncharacterized membrane protein YeaQ/YmgE (transglycosylase-associated protein family)
LNPRVVLKACAAQGVELDYIPPLARNLLQPRAMNPGAVIIVWIVVGAATGWLANKIVGGVAPSALANVSLGILGALAAGAVTIGLLDKLGFGNLDIAGIAGALFGSCALVFGSHAFSQRRA